MKLEGIGIERQAGPADGFRQVSLHEGLQLAIVDCATPKPT